MKVKLIDILEAIAFTNDSSNYFLDKVTGKIVWINEMAMTSQEQEEACDALDEHGFYRLPDKRELNEYHTMERFIETLPPPARDRLIIAISGRGAFRRFKDGVLRFGVEKAWYEFRDAAQREKAIEWCEENGIEYEE